MGRLRPRQVARLYSSRSCNGCYSGSRMKEVARRSRGASGMGQRFGQVWACGQGVGTCWGRGPPASPSAPTELARSRLGAHHAGSRPDRPPPPPLPRAPPWLCRVTAAASPPWISDFSLLAEGPPPSKVGTLRASKAFPELPLGTEGGLSSEERTCFRRCIHADTRVYICAWCRKGNRSHTSPGQAHSLNFMRTQTPAHASGSWGVGQVPFRLRDTVSCPPCGAHCRCQGLF